MNDLYQSTLQIAITFARRQLADYGQTFDQTVDRTVIFLHQAEGLPVAEAQATAWRAAGIAEQQVAASYVDCSHTTASQVSLVNPRTGERETVPVSIIQQALQCLQQRVSGKGVGYAH